MPTWIFQSTLPSLNHIKKSSSAWIIWLVIARDRHAMTFNGWADDHNHVVRASVLHGTASTWKQCCNTRLFTISFTQTCTPALLQMCICSHIILPFLLVSLNLLSFTFPPSFPPSIQPSSERASCTWKLCHSWERDRGVIYLCRAALPKVSCYSFPSPSVNAILPQHHRGHLSLFKPTFASLQRRHWHAGHFPTPLPKVALRPHKYLISHSLPLSWINRTKTDGVRERETEREKAAKQ